MDDFARAVEATLFASATPLTVDELQLVQFGDRPSRISNGDAAGLLKRLGIEEPQLRRSVAHD